MHASSNAQTSILVFKIVIIGMIFNHIFLFEKLKSCLPESFLLVSPKVIYISHNVFVLNVFLYDT